MSLTWYKLNINDFQDNTKVFDGIIGLDKNKVVRYMFNSDDLNYSNNLMISPSPYIPEIWNTSDNAFEFTINNKSYIFTFQDIISEDLYFNGITNTVEYDGIIINNGIYTQNNWNGIGTPSEYYIPINISLTPHTPFTWRKIDIILEGTNIFKGYVALSSNNVVFGLYELADEDRINNLLETPAINPDIWSSYDNTFDFPINGELYNYTYQDIISSNPFFTKDTSKTEYNGIISSNGIYTQNNWNGIDTPSEYYIPISIILSSINTPISDICFPEGIPITCDQGNIPIEIINPYIHTINNKKIIGVVKTISKDSHLICFEKDALGPNIPSQKTIISKYHNIFYNGVMKEAVKFVGMNDKIYRKKYKGEALYNVLMEQYDKMNVNNLVCETLDPNNRISELHKCLQLLNPIQQDELIKLYNEYVVNNILNVKNSMRNASIKTKY